MPQGRGMLDAGAVGVGGMGEHLLNNWNEVGMKNSRREYQKEATF